MPVALEGRRAESGCHPGKPGTWLAFRDAVRGAPDAIRNIRDALACDECHDLRHAAKRVSRRDQVHWVVADCDSGRGRARRRRLGPRRPGRRRRRDLRLCDDVRRLCGDRALRLGDPSAPGPDRPVVDVVAAAPGRGSLLPAWPESRLAATLGLAVLGIGAVVASHWVLAYPSGLLPNRHMRVGVRDPLRHRPPLESAVPPLLLRPPTCMWGKRRSTSARTTVSCRWCTSHRCSSGSSQCTSCASERSARLSADRRARYSSRRSSTYQSSPSSHIPTSGPSTSGGNTSRSGSTSSGSGHG